MISQSAIPLGPWHSVRSPRLGREYQTDQSKLWTAVGGIRGQAKKHTPISQPVRTRSARTTSEHEVASLQDVERRFSNIAVGDTGRQFLDQFPGIHLPILLSTFRSGTIPQRRGLEDQHFCTVHLGLLLSRKLRRSRASTLECQIQRSAKVRSGCGRRSTKMVSQVRSCQAPSSSPL